MDFKSIKNKISDFELVYNTENYLVCHQGDIIRINADYYYVLKAIQDSDTVQEGIQFLKTHAYDVGIHNFENIYVHIITTLESKFAEKQKDYTHFNVHLFSTKWIFTVLKKINVICIPSVFFVWFFITFAIGTALSVFMMQNADAYRIDIYQSPYYVMMFFAIAIMHECGHIIAASRISDKAPKVSFGIYIFIPVFFTDVSHIWVGKKIERIIVTMAGYGIQMGIAILYLSVGIYTDSAFISNSGFIAFIHAVIGLLLPFGRSDGYWLLVDITGIHNLVRDFYQRLYRWQWAGIKKISLIYGILNLSVMILFFRYAFLYTYAYFATIEWQKVYDVSNWEYGILYEDLIVIPMVLFIGRIIFKLLRRLWRMRTIMI